jgi:hypothetical protein
MLRDGTANVRIIAVEGSIPEVRFNVQIGAWGDLENALTHRIRLTDAGLKPTAELGSDGITRIFIPAVNETEVFPLANLLDSLGYTDLFIYQMR